MIYLFYTTTTICQRLQCLFVEILIIFQENRKIAISEALLHYKYDYKYDLKLKYTLYISCI